MALEYKDGFIVGERRAKEMADGIKQTEDNTKKILEVLIGEFRSMQTALKDQPRGQSSRVDLTRRIRQSRSATDDNPAYLAHKIAESVQSAVEDSSRKISNTKPPISVDQAIDDAEETKARKHREAVENSVKKRVEKSRDSKGRFVGAGASDDEAKAKNIVSSIKDYLGGAASGLGNLGTSGRGIDPTIDAIGELKDTLAPMGGIFKKMTVKGIGLFTGRRKKNPTDETITKEQAKDNAIDQKSDKERNSLLRRLIDATLRSGGGGGMLGGLGRMLGGGKGKGLMRGLLRKIPYLGVLLGGGALAMSWKDKDNKQRGKGVGEVAGMVVGGALGSFLGLPGTVLGGMIGHKLGGIFGEKVGDWVGDLKKIKFADLFVEAVKSSFSVLTKINPVANPVKQVYEAGKGLGGYISNKMGYGGGSGKMGGGGSGASYEGGASAGSAKITSNKTKDKRQLMMYDALTKAGFSHNQAIALGGEIGRENDYGDALFGQHDDYAKDSKGNVIRNIGAISWNGGRKKNFEKFMKDRGLMDKNGKMAESQEVLNAQAEFIKWEMENTHKNAGGKKFLSNPNLDPKNAAVPLAEYIGWARGQTTVRGNRPGERKAFNSKPHEQKINGYIDKGEALTKGRNAALMPNLKTAQQAVDQPKAKPKAVTPKAPQVKQTVIPYKPGIEPKQTARAQDTQMSQNVSDRSLAHIYSGGIGRHIG